MTLIKSLLLGSAAGIVAIASAQAADLPTRKGAPAAEYVRICSITVNGKPVVGWTLPGSDTCFKLTGYLTGQVEGGNLKVSQNSIYTPGAGFGTQTPGPTTAPNRPGFGYTTRLNFGFDAVSNTAYGPLLAHVEEQFEQGNGFSTDGNTAYLNLAYVTWAGITAGKAPSFFSFTGGGPGWNNFFSPDQQGFNQPDLLAYTASFGGGFSASIAAQSPGSEGGSGGGTWTCDFCGTNYIGNATGTNYLVNNERAPDVVANIKLSQGWGSAQLSGVGHYVDVTGWTGAIQRTWGWGIDAGVSFNLPQFGAGDEITVTGAYTEHAAWFSGIPDAMWGENGMTNGNGQQLPIGDTYFNPDGTTATPKMWTIASEVTHHFTPEFTASLEGSYGQIRWDGTEGVAGAGSMVSNANSWLAGVVAHWDPVKNLDFEFELLYQDSHIDQPIGFVYGGPGTNATWQSRADGFATRFEITRSW